MFVRSNKLFKSLWQIIKKKTPDFPYLGDEIAEPRPDTCMNITVIDITMYLSLFKRDSTFSDQR